MHAIEQVSHFVDITTQLRRSVIIRPEIINNINALIDSLLNFA